MTHEEYLEIKNRYEKAKEINSAIILLNSEIKVLKRIAEEDKGCVVNVCIDIGLTTSDILAIIESKKATVSDLEHKLSEV
jgi:hypothetical protein